MERIPHRIERRNLVGQELANQHRTGRIQHPIVREQSEIAGQGDIAKPLQDSKCEHYEIEADTAGPGQHGGDCDFGYEVHASSITMRA